MEKTSSMSGWYTTKEAAALKGVTEQAVRNRINRHELKAVKRGDVWLIARKALDKWEPRRPKPAEAAT